MDDQLVVWTVRLALLGLFACWALLLLRRPRPARWAASFGWLMMALHFCAAFAIVHDWSHSAAAVATAADTKATTGSDFKYGVWLNYAFLLFWLAELLLWWGNKRPSWLFWAVHGFLLFIAINATVVFEVGVVRWTSLAGLLVLLGLFARRLTSKPAQTAAS